MTRERALRTIVAVVVDVAVLVSVDVPVSVDVEEAAREGVAVLDTVCGAGGDYHGFVLEHTCPARASCGSSYFRHRNRTVVADAVAVCVCGMGGESGR